MDFDSSLVIIFLLVTLSIGIWKGRNIKTLEEYAVSNRKYPTAVLVATITATWYGSSSIVGETEKVYVLGIVFTFLSAFNLISKYLIGKYIAPKMSYFSNCISVGDIMEKLYGTRAKIITGICGIFLSMGYVGAQIGGLGYMLKYFFSIDPLVGIIIGAGIVVIYSTFGGIKSVTATDVLQFAAIIVIVPIMASIVFSQAGGFKNIVNTIDQQKLSIFIPDLPTFDFIFTITVFIIPFLNPSIIQRLLLSKNSVDVARSFKISGMIDIVFYSLIGLIGLSALTLDPSLEPKEVYFYIIEKTLPVGIKGFALIGLLAAIMSTADSYLNVASLSLVNDTLRPLRPNLNDKNLLLLTRVTSFVIGVGSIIMAVSFSSLVDIIHAALDYWGPIVVMPLMLGILGFRAGEKTFFISAVVGVIVYMILKYNTYTNVIGISYALLPAMLANAITFLTLRKIVDKEKINLSNPNNKKITVKKKI